jgi:hypothetical protein
MRDAAAGDEELYRELESLHEQSPLRVLEHPPWQIPLTKNR